MQDSKVIYGYYGTMRNFKARKSHELGTTIVVVIPGKKIIHHGTPKRRCSRDVKNVRALKLARGLSYLYNRVYNNIYGEENKQLTEVDCKKFIDYIADFRRLATFFEAIKSNSPESIRKLILPDLKKISTTLKAGKFKFRSNRRREGVTYLTLVSLYDQIVQKSIANALSNIYEPLSVDYKYGNFKKLTPLTALEHIRRTFKSSKWVMTVDIKGCFDNIKEIKLIELLKKRIRCEKTLALIHDSLKADMTSGLTIKKKIRGLPACSNICSNICSTLLSNIYLHDFDLFIEELKKKEDKGLERARNPVYDLWLDKRRFASKEGNKKESRALYNEIKRLASNDQRDPDYQRISYCRYAGEFIIGVAGSVASAKDILNRVNFFLKQVLDLKIDNEKNKIRSFTKGIAFLGTLIDNGYIKGKAYNLRKSCKIQGTSTMSFRVNINKLIIELVEKNYFVWINKPKKLFRATARRNLINLAHSAIIRNYSRVVIVLRRYYKCAYNLVSLDRLMHQLKLSCALTLALKYKLKTKSKVFKKFGQLLADPTTKLGFACMS